MRLHRLNADRDWPAIDVAKSRRSRAIVAARRWCVRDRRPGLVVLLAVALGASSAAPAAAGMQIGTGQNPAIAVDGSGMAHVVWSEPVSRKVDVLHYWRIPNGASACSDEQRFTPFDGQGSDYNADGPQDMLTQFSSRGERQDLDSGPSADLPASSLVLTGSTVNQTHSGEPRGVTISG